jgi:hypothetical protein
MIFTITSIGDMQEAWGLAEMLGALLL